MSSAITSTKIILIVISLLILLPTILIHFRYKETLLESEIKVRKASLLKIISNYKIFFQRKTKYCRTFFLFLIYIQGFIMYEAFYEYELINNYGFSEDTMNTIINIIFLPINLIAFFVNPYLVKIKWIKSMMACFITKYIIWVIVLILFPSSVVAVSAIFFLTQLI